MKIAVDYQSAQGQRTGIGVYAQNLLSALEKTAPEMEFIRYTESGKSDLNTPRRIFWESFRIPLRAAVGKPDLIFSPGFAPAYVSLAPQVVTVHDLIGMIYPENLPPAARFYWSKWLPACIRRARVVVASSESTRRDMARLLRMDSAKIRVVPLAGSADFHPVDSAAVARTRTEFGLSRPYFITVGTLEPRKNIPNLLRAFKAFSERVKDGPALVLAGKPGSAQHDLRIQALIGELNLEKSVRRLGYVRSDALNALLNGAMGYVFPSTYEGFGLPVLEAMQCGLSGVCSSASSLPEVAGDTAVYCDPSDAADMADKLEHFWRDEAMRVRLSTLALERSKNFDWARTAETMATIFRGVLL